MTLNEIILSIALLLVIIIALAFQIASRKRIAHLEALNKKINSEHEELAIEFDNLVHQNNALKEVYNEYTIQSKFELESIRRQDAEKRLEVLENKHNQDETISLDEKEQLIAEVNEKNRLIIEAENKAEAYQKELEEIKQKMEKELDKELDEDEEEVDDDSELSDEEEEKKIAALIEDYQKKFKAEWENEIFKKFPELMKKHLGRKDFAERVLALDANQKENYVTLKNIIMEYNVSKNRITKYFDTFYSGNKVICKIAIIGKTIKLYMALDPNKYEESKFPHKDVGNKKRHKNTPYVMKITSPLSLRRANKLLEDLFALNEIDKKETYKKKDYVRSIQTIYYNKTKN